MELGSGCKCSGLSIDLRRLPAGEKNHGREDRQLHGELLEQLLLDARVHAAEVHVGLQVLGHLSFTLLCVSQVMMCLNAFFNAILASLITFAMFLHMTLLQFRLLSCGIEGGR